MNQTAQAPEKRQNMTPANVPSLRPGLRPLPLRVSESQYERLGKARFRTGISIQEHVRRGIDVYLAIIEKEAVELGYMIDPRSDQGPQPPQRPDTQEPVDYDRPNSRSAIRGKR